ncbi:unnamed protein product, partial [Brassica rapa subsp. narinosa]
LRLRTCYRSFIINQGIFTSSQLTPRSQIHSEITSNFLKKIFCEKKKVFFFPSSFFFSSPLSFFLSVFLFWDDFPLHLSSPFISMKKVFGGSQSLTK